MNAENHEYDVNLVWEKDRIGTLSSDKLSQTLEVATPPEFPGGVEGIWSPEHLFTASVSSCFMTTFLAIAEYSKLDFESLNVKTLGILGKVNDKFAMTEIILKPRLVITDEKLIEKAHRILIKAESACLITRSVKSLVKLEPEVVIGILD